MRRIPSQGATEPSSKDGFGFAFRSSGPSSCLTGTTLEPPPFRHRFELFPVTTPPTPRNTTISLTSPSPGPHQFTPRATKPEDSHGHKEGGGGGGAGAHRATRLCPTA